jgi:hypothetical protein
MSRVRGLAPWTPRERTLPLLNNVSEILEQYTEQLPLTLRQVFYRLVGAYSYDKTENAYERLGETLNRARRAGAVPFNAIRDDGATAFWPREFVSPEDFWDWLSKQVGDFTLSAQYGQAQYLELWVEAAGMAPMAFNAANPNYGVPVFSSGGFDSTTIKYEAACRFLDRDRPTVVIHVGDYDPSGVTVFQAIREDVRAFYDDLGGDQPPTFARAAVTREQIDRFDLPTSPPKEKDKRSAFNDTIAVQAEALPPDVLQAEVRTVVESYIDHAVLADRRKCSNVEHERLLAEIKQQRGE